MQTNTNTTDINPVKPSDILPLARFVATTDQFLFILGAAGVGKTSIVKEVASALDRELWYVNWNGTSPNEVLGYGMPNHETGDMPFAAPPDLPTLKRVGDKPCVLFIDEFPDCEAAIQALARSLYPATGVMRIGTHILGSDILVVVAGNRKSDGVRNARVEEAPMTNRCYKVTLVSDLGDWLDWIDTRPDLLAVGSHIPAFLKFGTTTGEGSDHFHPGAPVPFDGVPFPSPRSWCSAIDAEVVRGSDARLHNILLRGCVGDRAASAYVGFLSLVDRLPDIQLLKANPDAFVVPTGVAEQYALVSGVLACCTRGVSDPGVMVHSGGADYIISLLLRVRRDICAWGARSAVRRGIPLDEHARSHELLCD